MAYSILEDTDRNLWFGTNQGLVRFNPETHKIRVFTKEDGLLGNQFNYKSALKASDGKFYFGGVDGLISFLSGYGNLLRIHSSGVYHTAENIE